jgi:hypothetical protein
MTEQQNIRMRVWFQLLLSTGRKSDSKKSFKENNKIPLISTENTFSTFMLFYMKVANAIKLFLVQTEFTIFSLPETRFEAPRHSA